MKNQKINKKVAFVVTAILLLCLIALAISPAIASTKQNALSGQETQITEQESLPKSMLNSVVFITFEQQGDNYPNGFFDNVYRMYQTSATSVKNYVKHQSGGLLNVDTNVLNHEQTVVKVSNPANYYKPRYRWINNTYELVNELGYDNRYYSEDGSVVDYQSQRGKLNVEYALREQQLIREVVEKLELDSNYCTDADYDGIVDSLVIITDLSTTVEWGEVLWAHMGTCHNFTDNVLNTFYYTDEQKSECQNLKNIMLGDAFVLSYNMIPLGNITSAKAANYNPCIAKEDDLYNVGLLCHEFMHTLGIYDYYSYQDGTYESVGEFDLMATTNPAPQNMLAYLRYKLGWLDYNDWLYVHDSG
ncbi:MAG: hypothetical protein IJW13_05060, partial [Clostridia bacterium]|nr:hypothetical protein [Clostridia bacterium]